MKDLSKQYQLLTPEERFRLFVDAMGRRDEQELDRLENSCPQKLYRMQDYEYTRRKTRFITYSLATALEQMRLELLAHVALVVGLTEDDNEEIQAKSMDAFLKLMQTRKGKQQAWTQFCELLGVAPDIVTAPFLGNVKWAMQPAETVAETLEEEAPDEISGRAAEREVEILLAAWK